MAAKMSGKNLMRAVTINEGFCNHCRYVGDDGMNCRAFPKGIPLEILRGEVDHRAHVEGDNGIKFDWRED